MSSADSPLERAIRELRFTMPLPEADPRYVERRDNLGQRLLNRVMVPSAERLLLAGPAGCGKSTELRRISAAAAQKYTVVLCPCDRDLDLHRPTRGMLLDYVMVRVMAACSAENIKLSSDIGRDLRRLVDVPDRIFEVDRPGDLAAEMKAITTTGARTERHVEDDFRAATLSRLCAEIDRQTRRVLLLVDGLEKVPAGDLKDVVLNGFIRSSALAECHSLTVIPHWAVFGWGAQQLYQDTEIFEVPVDEDPTFVARVLERRAPGVFGADVLEEIGRLSGGVVRDGLQLGHNACRAAMDASAHQVEPEHVERSRREMVRTYVNVFSDDPSRALSFLTEVRSSGELPGDPEWRDRMLASGAVLPRPDGTFRVHPVLDDPRFFGTPA